MFMRSIHGDGPEFNIVGASESGFAFFIRCKIINSDC